MTTVQTIYDYIPCYLIVVCVQCHLIEICLLTGIMVNRGNSLRGNSYQQVVSKTCVELTSENGGYHQRLWAHTNAGGRHDMQD